MVGIWQIIQKKYLTKKIAPHEQKKSAKCGAICYYSQALRCCVPIDLENSLQFASVRTVGQIVPILSVHRCSVGCGQSKRSITRLIARGDQKKKLIEEYDDHELSGDWKEHRELHVLPDWLLIYYLQKDVLVLTLSRTGSHSDLLKKQTLSARSNEASWTV